MRVATSQYLIVGNRKEIVYRPVGTTLWIAKTALGAGLYLIFLRQLKLGPALSNSSLCCSCWNLPSAYKQFLKQPLSPLHRLGIGKISCWTSTLAGETGYR
jgi:hypothetical protein